MYIKIKGMNIFNFIQLAVSVLAAMSYLAAISAQFSREIVFKPLNVNSFCCFSYRNGIGNIYRELVQYGYL